MKKYCLLLSLMILTRPFLFAQPDANKYPEPEFAKEVYFLKKDSANVAIRLEKGRSKMENKTKMGGMGGFESGYTLNGERSPVRIPEGSHITFIYSTGMTARPSSAQADSIMRANGMDPAAMQEMSTMDPTNMITLYKVEKAKSKRKVTMMKGGGAFAGKKSDSGDKLTFSVRKIREGYWELVPDKPLTKGEYTFSMMDMSGTNMDGGSLFYSFGID